MFTLVTTYCVCRVMAKIYCVLSGTMSNDLIIYIKALIEFDSLLSLANAAWYCVQSRLYLCVSVLFVL